MRGLGVCRAASRNQSGVGFYRAPLRNSHGASVNDGPGEAANDFCASSAF